ncbi:MAG TPA: DNA methyltransferase, partial [Actinomycetes bacterium]|nr:DNA methyltransferase [Actinomycetes bacterium]
ARVGFKTGGHGWRDDGERCHNTITWSPVGHGHTDVDHEAAFSRDLADAYVLCYSPPSGLVGDPFVGSGTVAFACHRHGRSFIGGDLGVRKETTVHGRKVPCGRRWADIVNDGLRQTRLFA